jgi:ComF family protein
MSCGRPVAHTVLRCTSCQQLPLPLQQLRAATLFERPVAQAIHQMKYEGLFALAEPLADLMLTAWPRWQVPVDLVLPIPLHPRRQQDRGYNQAGLLVKHLCCRLGWATEAKAVWRVRHTRPQVGLDASERRRNLLGGFAADAALVAGKEILLVDDVCTTGATLTAAAEVLLAAGAASVSGYCVARAAVDQA